MSGIDQANGHKPTGLTHVFDPAFASVPKPDPATLGFDLEARLRALCGRAGPDLVLECAGVASTIQRSVELVRRGGRVGLLGLASTPATIEPGVWLAKEIELISSLGYTREEFETAQDLVVDGRLRLAPLVTETIALPGLEDAFERSFGRRPTIEFFGGDRGPREVPTTVSA